MARQQQKLLGEFEKFQIETRGGMQSMASQVSHLTQAMAKTEQKQGTLPPQVQIQPNAQVNAVGLRSGRTLIEKKVNPGQEAVDIEDLAEEEEPLAKEDEPLKVPTLTKEIPLPKEQDKKETNVRPPFPGRLVKNKEADKMSEMLKIFKKVEINIPLITALTSMPRSAKFLKELCTKRVKYTNDARFPMGANVSVVIKRDLPIKCTDSGMFYIPCVIRTTRIKQAMLDLGASINVMPLSMYEALRIGPLKPSCVEIQLADKLCVYPEGIVEDVFVKVQDLIFPADFHVLNMGSTRRKKQLMLLGRPFLKTARTLIDCDTGKLTCQFAGETVTFDIYKAEQFPADAEIVDQVEVVEQAVKEAAPHLDRQRIRKSHPGV